LYILYNTLDIFYTNFIQSINRIKANTKAYTYFGIVFLSTWELKICGKCSGGVKNRKSTNYDGYSHSSL